MDLNIVPKNFSVDEFDSLAPEAGSDNTVTTHGETIGELARARHIVTRLELDLACSSEKLINLTILTMHVDDYQNSALETQLTHDDLDEKTLQFDLLSGFLDSEVRQVEDFLQVLETEIVNGHQLITLFKHLGDTFFEMEQKLIDSEESLKQSKDQISDLRTQSSRYQRILLGEENGMP
ncbi:hypothetical protein ACFE04_006797 [Oxalis oulophora]